MGIGSFIVGALVGAGGMWMWQMRKKGHEGLQIPGMPMVQDAMAFMDPRGSTNAFVDPYGSMQYTRYNPFTGQDSNSVPISPQHARLGVRIA